MVHKSKYIFSFTGASALIAETLIVAEELVRLKDWKAVKQSVVDSNLLNKIKQTTFKREFSEIKKRLSLLTVSQLQLMVKGSLDDAKAMILLSLVKAYSYLNDFIVEFLRNKYLSFETTLLETDYSKFYASKSLSHPELTAISQATAGKVKQVIFKLLEQVGMVTQAKNGTILRPVLSRKAIDAIVEDDPAFLNSFLYSNEEIKSVLQKSKNV